MTETTPEPRHVPSATASSKRVMKVDLFERVTQRMATLDLVPVFPYLGDGDIVPCITVAVGNPEMKKFQFFHANTVSESVLCLAGHEAAMKTGQIMALSPVHGVNTFLRHPQDPNCFNVMLLPIRMNFDRVQEEGFILRCAKCNEVVYERRFNVKQGLERPHYPEFHALKYYTECCEEFNSSEDKRICPSCGHLQDRYPIEQMGWRVYRENIGVANRGRDILSEAADSSAGASTGAPAVEARAPAPVGP